MLVRKCNRCNKTINPRDNYVSIEAIVYGQDITMPPTIDLCEECSRFFEGFVGGTIEVPFK